MPRLTSLSGKILSTSGSAGSPGLWEGGDPTYTFLENADPSTGQGDDFGEGVAIAAGGEYAVVGAPDDIINGISCGSISIYNKSGGVWSKQATKLMTARSSGDGYGRPVAIDGGGNRIIATAFSDDITQDGSGSVTVTARSGSTWTNEAVLVADDPQIFGAFGFPSIDLNSDDGSYAIIGQQNWDNGPGGLGTSLRTGRVYVFVRSGTTWSLQQSFVSQNFTAREDGYFGSAVSVNPDATYLFVGAQGAGGANQVSFSGLGFIWTRSGSTWSQQDFFWPSDAVAGDDFGYSGSINDDGTYVAVGAPVKNNSEGAVYIFTRSGSTWSQQAKLTISGSLRLGHNVSINSDATLLAISDVSNASSVRGQVHIYKRQGTSWSLIRSLTQPVNEPDSDITSNNYGMAFQFNSSGNQLIVGAGTTDYPALSQNNVGAAYIYEVPSKD